MKVSRNAPCPCGSGEKYKRCCLQKDEQESRLEAPPPPIEEPSLPKIPLYLSLGFVVLFALLFGFWKGIGTGLILGAAGLLGMLIYWGIRGAPAPREGGDPAGLSFGTKSDPPKRK